MEDGNVVYRIDEVRDVPAAIRFISFEPLIRSVGPVDLTGIDWAIVGGESGPRARPIQELWIDEIHDACRAYGTAFFFKQWGHGVKTTSAGQRNRTVEPTEVRLGTKCPSPVQCEDLSVWSKSHTSGKRAQPLESIRNESTRFCESTSAATYGSGTRIRSAVGFDWRSSMVSQVVVDMRMEVLDHL